MTEQLYVYALWRYRSNRAGKDLVGIFALPEGAKEAASYREGDDQEMLWCPSGGDEIGTAYPKETPWPWRLEKKPLYDWELAGISRSETQ